MARIIAIIGVLVGGLVCLLVLNYKDMGADIPNSDELGVIEANSLRAEYPWIRKGGGSIEFHDADGLRFQTPRVSEEDLKIIEEALRKGVPVTIRYGRWLSRFPSSKIFTVYQLEVGGSILMPYERLAQYQKKTRDSMGLVLTLSTVVGLGAIGYGVWLGMRIRRVSK